MTVVYTPGEPGNAAVTPLPPGCEAAGAELAIAVVLSKPLGFAAR